MHRTIDLVIIKEFPPFIKIAHDYGHKSIVQLLIITHSSIPVTIKANERQKMDSYRLSSIITSQYFHEMEHFWLDEVQRDKPVDLTNQELYPLF